MHCCSCHNEKKEKSTMNSKDKAIHESFMSLILKFWLFLMTFTLLKESVECFGIDSFVKTIEEKSFISVNNNAAVNEEKSTSSENRRYCQYFKMNNRLICYGSVDFDYLKTIKEGPITDFIVEKYEAESIYKKKYWSNKNLKTGEWYTKLPKIYQNLVGEVHIKNTGIQINVILRLVPRKDLKGFLIEGEAFSNKIIKISWRLKGDLSLDFIKNRTLVSINAGADYGESDWSLHTNLTFNRRSDEGDIDNWKTVGILKSRYVSENEFVLYRGTVGTRMMKGECRFFGEFSLQSVNVVGALSGSVSPPQNKQITIPKSAFSNMTIKNIIFKDSNFFNDFDKNAFQDVQGVETITFINSKLEVMPKLNELFQTCSSLKEIYIEDCVTPQLKFGSMPVLKNVQRISFKGSGPLYFDDISFAWLKGSNLNHINLQHSHVKISAKAASILWSLNNTLKYLDISYSTLTEEKDLVLILKGTNITDLKAEGLRLKKIPTSALSYVKKFLKYLSLRGNYFRKSLEKYMFDNILNFPLMPSLTELNLMECHINYLEKGSFDNLPSLKILRISYNNLENLQDAWAATKPNIRILDLSNNGLAPFIGMHDATTSMNLSVLEEINSLDLSNGIYKNLNKLIVSLKPSLKNLALRDTNLEDIPENLFQNLHNLEVLDMSYNKNIKAFQSFSFNLFKDLKELKVLNLKQCRISDSTMLKNIYVENYDSENFLLQNLKSLDLSFNNIKILDFDMLKMFPNLKILNLSGNSITVWKKSLFSFNKDLKSVYLDENKIESITPDMMSDIKKLQSVKIGNNPFICESYVYEMLEIFHNASQSSLVRNFGIDFFQEEKNTGFTETENKENLENIFEKRRYSNLKKLIHAIRKKEENLDVGNKGVKILDWSEKNYVCFSWSQSRFIPFVDLNETFDGLPDRKRLPRERTLLWLPVIALAGLVTTIAIICWKWLDVHLITRAVRNAVALSFLGLGEKEPTHYDYNVFVSYSDKDRSWVVDQLLPQLESLSEVRVCLHERDFKVGLSIIENIIASIDGSKNIILVLTQAFLKSQWCQYEMHLAQHRLLEKGRDQLIIIFLENIPAVKRPKTLKYLMMTKTYLEWPLNSKNQSNQSAKEVEVFWSRLMKSLSKSN